jgi:hypothetical protein
MCPIHMGNMRHVPDSISIFHGLESTYSWHTTHVSTSPPGDVIMTPRFGSSGFSTLWAHIEHLSPTKAMTCGTPKEVHITPGDVIHTHHVYPFTSTLRTSEVCASAHPTSLDSLNYRNYILLFCLIQRSSSFPQFYGVYLPQDFEVSGFISLCLSAPCFSRFLKSERLPG